MVFCEGAAATRQKLFQMGCRNHYCAELAVVPMVLYGTAFWDGPSNIGPVFRKCAKGTLVSKLETCPIQADSTKNGSLQRTTPTRLSTC